MTAGKRLAVVTLVLGTGVSAALFFRKDATRADPREQQEAPDTVFREPSVQGPAQAQAPPLRATRAVVRPAKARYRPPIVAAGTSQSATVLPSLAKTYVPAFAKLREWQDVEDGNAAIAPGRLARDHRMGNRAPHERALDERDVDWEGALDNGPRRHRIVDGDTLSSIAAQYLGDVSRHPEIFALNRAVLDRPDLLPIGKTLTIPARRGRRRRSAIHSSSGDSNIGKRIGQRDARQDAYEDDDLGMVPVPRRDRDFFPQ